MYFITNMILTGMVQMKLNINVLMPLLNRLETGTFTQDDVTWIKHECAERHHELKYDSGYTEAHERAQSRYDGYPWENKF